jgi:hypothetical protein
MDRTTQTEINHNSCTQEQCVAYDNIEETKSKNNKRKQNLDCSANFCVVCGVNMGDNNPRQLCRKTFCPREEYE